MRLLSIFLCNLLLILGSTNVMANEPPLSDMLSAYAKAFAGKTKAPFQLPHPELLNTSKLDGSVSSLNIVDKYLSELIKAAGSTESNKNANKGLNHKSISMVSMLAGAYIGEVIISASKKGHHWVLFTEYAKSHPEAKRSEPESVYTEYLIVNKAKNITMPLNSIAHYLDSGKGFNAHQYVTEQLK